jgi:hypothetical protein
MVAEEPKAKEIVNWISIAVIIGVTIFAMRYIEKKETAIRPAVVHKRRKLRQFKLQEMADSGTLPADLEQGPRRDEHARHGGGAVNAREQPTLAMPAPTRAEAYPPLQYGWEHPSATATGYPSKIAAVIRAAGPDLSSSRHGGHRLGERRERK